jgi:serine/threonine protein phosphatase 1
MGRTFVVGDVHGCIEELCALVEKLAPQACDRFVFLGDLVDKGPKSLEVLRYVRSVLDRYPGSACIAGNHEEKALRLYKKALADVDAFGRASEHWKKIEPWAEDATVEDWKFIESMPLVHRFRKDGIHAIAVHGGLYPKFFTDHPEGIGEVPSKWHRGGGKKMDRLRKILRVRMVETDGGMVPLGGETPECKQWADLYDGREGFAFYGHEPFVSSYYTSHALGLDTGCVLGGELTAAILNHGVEPSNVVGLVSTRALKAYEPRANDGFKYLPKDEG